MATATPVGAHSPSAETLRSQWRIVIVVTPASATLADQTISDVLAQSLGSDISVLAAADPACRSALERVTLPVSFDLPVPPAHGCYWIEVLSACPVGGQCVIFLPAGSRVPPHWDARLVAAFQRADAAGVMPLSAAHPYACAFAEPSHTPGLGVDALDQWVNEYARCTPFAVPALLPGCLLLQHPDWDALVSAADSDSELMQALRDHGLSLEAVESVYIDDSACTGVLASDEQPEPFVSGNRQQPGLASMRHALSELSRSGQAPPLQHACLPVQLHIGHSWGGGLERWIEDFLAADRDHRHLVLRSIGDREACGRQIGLYRSTAMDRPLKTWQLHEPVYSVLGGSSEYRKIIAELIADYQVESLVVSSLVGHSLDLLRTSLPTTVVLHEFFPYCPALYATYDSPCESCEPQRLSACRRENPSNTFFPSEPDSHWLAVRAEYVRLLLETPATVVAPSQSVVQRYVTLEPGLAFRSIEVVPHGLDAAFAAQLRENPAPQTDNSRLSVVILGRLTQEKGGDLVPEFIAELTGFADVALIGCGESGMRFASLPGVTVVESYQRDELPGLIASAGADLGLLLSTVPETFSYTLSELQAAAIPVVAARLGALRERVVDGETGWLVEPAAGPVLDCLRGLASDREAIGAAARRLKNTPVMSTDVMVERYAALEPRHEGVPVARYLTPRRAWVLERDVSDGDSAAQALHVNPQRPYRQALVEFINHSAARASQSPSLPGPVRGTVSSALRAVARLLA